MASPEITLRRAVYTLLYAKLTAESYSYNDFYIRESWFPRLDADGVEMEKGILSVITQMSDKEIISRGKAYRQENVVYLQFQRNLVDSGDVDEIDPFVELIEEFFVEIKDNLEVPGYALSRFQFFKDSSNPETAVSPVQLRQNVFEIVGIANFNRGAS